MIGHLQTTINSVFVEYDKDGDVVKRHPYTLELTKLEESQFVEAFKTVDKLKDDLKKAFLEQQKNGE